MMRDAMTTLVDVLTPEGESSVAPHRRVWVRLLVGFGVGFVLALGLAAAALLAYDAGYDGRILPGVHVGDVDVSGLSHTQASEALSSAFPYDDGRVVVRTVADDLSVDYGEFARRADVEAMIAAAMGAGRTGSPFERAVAEVRMALDPVSLEPQMALDAPALTATIEAALARLDLEPVDSQVIMSGPTLYSTPARAGRTFDGAAAAAAALEVVSRPDAPTEVVIEAPATAIPPEHGDGEALVAIAAAKRMTVNVVVTLGDDKWTIKSAIVRGWLHLETRPDGSTWPTVDEAVIAKSLGGVAKGVRRDPVSARFLKTRGGRVVGVVASTNGRTLDAAATATTIARTLVDRGLGAAATPVTAQVASVPPKLSTAEAVKQGPQMVKLGSWKTWFPVSERNYFGANIWLPAKTIDGTVLLPGQRFEWWSALGPVNSASGYGPGGFIAGDHTEPTGALGGGMCSSSTTLFNAALRAGLDMGSRANHTYYINRYPLGLDATVSKTRRGTQTVSFTNDMKNPIVIRTFRYRAGGKGWVRYEIWGIPDGRTVSLSKPAVSNVRKAVTNTVYVSTLRRGVREQVEYPANGMDVSVTRVVRRNGAVIHRDTYRTHYVLWNGLVQIGR